MAQNRGYIHRNQNFQWLYKGATFPLSSQPYVIRVKISLRRHSLILCQHRTCITSTVGQLTWTSTIVTMQIQGLLTFVTVLVTSTFGHPLSEDAPTSSHLEPRGSCINGGTQACVTYFGSKGCQDPLGSYHPTCNGNCFQYDNFMSLEVKGSFLYSTKCTYYADNSCSEVLGDSGDVFGTQCLSASEKARSMKCYYDCWEAPLDGGYSKTKGGLLPKDGLSLNGRWQTACGRDGPNPASLWNILIWGFRCGT